MGAPEFALNEADQNILQPAYDFLHTLRQLAREAVRRWYLIALTVIVCLAGAVVVGT